MLLLLLSEGKVTIAHLCERVKSTYAELNSTRVVGLKRKLLCVKNEKGFFALFYKGLRQFLEKFRCKTRC